MVLGVGIDMMKRHSLCRAFLVPEDPFFRKTFAEGEAREASQRGDPYAYLEGRFCLKEAVYKALRPLGNVPFCEIAIVTDDRGAPCVRLSGRAQKEAEARGVKRVLVSLSYEKDMIVSVALAQDE